MSTRVLILVLSVDREPWRSIERDGQRSTWAAPSGLDPDAPVLFYRGRSSGLERFVVAAVLRALRVAGAERSDSVAQALRTLFLRRLGRGWSQRPATTVGDVVHTAVPETYGTVTPKTVAAFAHVLATEEFDFLLRTNTSTYIDRRRLLDLADGLPRRQYWGGFIGTSSGTSYTSGAGTLLSRDLVVESLLDAWDWALLDDVALGRVLRKRGHEPQPLPRPEYTSVEQVAEIDPNACMWRCKSEPARDDAAIMRAVHRELGSNG